MRKILLPLLCIGMFFILSCEQADNAQWARAECPIPTQWSDDVDPQNPWASYPRPQMVREDWVNLNGLWEYTIIPKTLTEPESFQDHILVPYPVESALSGVKRPVGEDNVLWYQTEIQVPAAWSGKDVLLHFEASDWHTRIWIDDHFVGEHWGGYDPFYFNISEFIGYNKTHILKVSVWDPTSNGYQPRGKQINEPEGIFYTSVTGIWQTVWMEPVPGSFIQSFKVETDIKQGNIKVIPKINRVEDEDILKITVLQNNEEIATNSDAATADHTIIIPDPNLWFPDSPFLYDLKIELIRDDEAIDVVDSYFGMREISLGKDNKGIMRMALNGRFIFQNGPLDEGYWPDGLYTAPTEEAMVFDLEKIKEMGFNMLRKHVKIEPRLFYSWCDRLGLLVWQDMPNAHGYVAPDKADLEPDEVHKEQFEFELSQLVQMHWNHPSIVMWVAFNEGWGQYDTERIVDLIKGMDQTRLVCNTSGWADRGVGDIYDLHHYPEPIPVQPEAERAAVLGEFGGLGYPVEGHTWEAKNWGYENMEDTSSLIKKYAAFYELVGQFKNDPGISACIYTQTTDVETETNGLMTYDRAIVKMNMKQLFQINQKVIHND